jgi:hypothetical protein
MSHFDAGSTAAAFTAGLDEPWAAKAMGINTTNTRARTRLTDFETRAYMRLSSAIKLTDKMVEAASSTISGSD